MKILILVFSILIVSLSPVLASHHYRKGKCWGFKSINQQALNQELCLQADPQETRLVCTRERGHKGKHHSHGRKKCFEKWK